MTRGRKKDMTIPPSRALSQQRDYRARKAQYLSELELRCKRLEEENERLKKELAWAQAGLLLPSSPANPETVRKLFLSTSQHVSDLPFACRTGQGVGRVDATIGSNNCCSRPLSTSCVRHAVASTSRSVVCDTIPTPNSLNVVAPSLISLSCAFGTLSHTSRRKGQITSHRDACRKRVDDALELERNIRTFAAVIFFNQRSLGTFAKPVL
jgi:hypothetical protein